MRYVVGLIIAAACVGCQRSDAAQGSPARNAAVLAAQIGTWHSEGFVSDGTDGHKLEAAWRCRPGARGAANDCKWRLKSRHPLLGVENFEPALATFMHTLEPAEPGMLRGTWEFEYDGEHGVGTNEVRIVSEREWDQRTSIDLAGRRVLELRITHHRVR